MGAVLFAALAGVLFGAFAVVIRRGLQSGGDPELGAVVVTGIGVLVGVRRNRRAGAAITLVPCLVSTAAILFDGDLAHRGLATAEIGLQLVNVAVIWTMLAVSVARLGRDHLIGHAEQRNRIGHLEARQVVIPEEHDVGIEDAVAPMRQRHDCGDLEELLNVPAAHRLGPQRPPELTPLALDDAG